MFCKIFVSKIFFPLEILPSLLQQSLQRYVVHFFLYRVLLAFIVRNFVNGVPVLSMLSYVSSLFSFQYKVRIQVDSFKDTKSSFKMLIAAIQNKLRY